MSLQSTAAETPPAPSSATASFTIAPATTPEDLAAVKELFTAYAASLPIDLGFQNFATELATLPGAYSAPYGILLLARSTGTSTPAPTPSPASIPPGTPLGCIALRPLPSLSPRTSECKRLYTIPSARGLGLGRALVDAVLEEARARGYREVRLDTLGSMRAARKLYEKRGFREVERYYDSPVRGTVFMGLWLGEEGSGEGKVLQEDMYGRDGADEVKGC